MSISAAGGSLATTAIQRPDPTQHRRPPGPPDAALAPTADLLGMSTGDLRSSLADGTTTLAQLAKDRGVSRDDLLASIEAGLKASPPPGADATSDLSALAADIADGVRPKDGPGGPPPPRASSTSVADAATLAGLSEDALAQRFGSADALAQLLEGTGISASTLASTLGGLRFDGYA